MKHIYFAFLLMVFTLTGFSNDNIDGLGEPLYYPIAPDRIEFSHNGNANRDFLDDIKLIGNSSYDHYPFSFNNWCMSYNESAQLTYIVFTDCDDEGHGWEPGTYERFISFNTIDIDGEPMCFPEVEAESFYSGYPDLITSVSGRPYIAFHKNDNGYYPWIKGDIYNSGDGMIAWHDKVHPPTNADWIWPIIRITRPTNGSEGIIYMMATDSAEPYGKAQICRATPQIDLNGWLADPFYTFENTVQVINEEESILHPTMAVSEDGSVIGVVYTIGHAEQAKCKYVYSTNEGASWSLPVDLAFDNSPCDVDGDGENDGNWSVSGTGMHLFYNALNEPCLSYVKNVSMENSSYYPFTSKIYFGKIDVENEELIEYRVSDVIDTEGDITGGCCGPNTLSIGARPAWGNGGQVMAIVWTDSRNMLAEECYNAEIYYSYSTDCGETWSQDINVSNTNSGACDWDEVFVTVSSNLRILNGNTFALEISFINDHSPGSWPGENPTMNEIYFYRLPFYNSIADGYMINERQNLKLHQNAPNPFNPVTNISYELGEAGVVSLNIYNVKGQLIKKLIDDEVKTPGSHSVIWDGRNSAGESAGSGVYFYKLKTNDSILTRKMLLLK